MASHESKPRILRDDAGEIVPSWVWGLPLSPVTRGEALDEISRRIDDRERSFYLSANLNFAMLADRDAELRGITRRAALILTDGMPLVWASRIGHRPIPERVAGSDLIFWIARLAARRGYSVFLLGGAPGVGDEAARRLCELNPGLKVVGIESPRFGSVPEAEEAALIARIRKARPDILLMAASQPKGEKWLIARMEAMGVPACFQLGASLDFAAGRVPRAPRWIQRIGMEWAFRLAIEPKRLARRYFENALFLTRMMVFGPRKCDPGPSSVRVSNVHAGFHNESTLG